VAGNPYNAPAALHHPLGSFDIYVCRIPVPVISLNEARGKQYVDNKHHYLLEAAPAGLDEPLFVLIGKACKEVIECPFAATVIVLKHLSSEKARKSQVRLDTKSVQDEEGYPQRSVSKPVQNRIGFFFLSSFFARLRHSV